MDLNLERVPVKSPALVTRPHIRQSVCCLEGEFLEDILRADILRRSDQSTPCMTWYLKPRLKLDKGRDDLHIDRLWTGIQFECLLCLSSQELSSVDLVPD